MRSMVGRWLLPALFYIVTIGALGIATKLALRHMKWPDMVVWTMIVYVIAAVVIVLVRGAHLGLGIGDRWAALAGLLAVLGLIALFVALDNGPVTRVVPVTAAYPLVTVVLGVLVFSEHVTPLRLAGMLLVVGGVVLLTLQRT
jgi:bacterial/archaeal transporter family protein